MDEKILILYATRRGKTSTMADIVYETLTQNGFKPKKMNVFQASLSDLKEATYLILGSSTWNDGTLQDDFVPFEREWKREKLNLKGHLYAVFGPGDTRFTHFCEAVRILEARCRASGAKPVAAPFQWDELSGRFQEQSEEWAESVVQGILKQKKRQEKRRLEGKIS